MKKSEHSLREIGTPSKELTYASWESQKKQKKDKWAERILKEMMTGNFSNLKKDMKINIQETR